jgi:hypothetical protein
MRPDVRRLLLFRLLAVAAVLAPAGGCTPGADTPLLRVVATDPGADAMLGPQQRFHIRFSLTSSVPLVVTLDPYFQREPLSANLGTSAPVTLPAGGGTAVAHLFFWGDHATRVDEIRLVARVPKKPDIVTETSLPVKLAWVAREMPARQPAAWVTEARSSKADPPAQALDERSQWLVFGAVLVAVALSGFTSRWLRRRWRARQDGE